MTQYEQSYFDRRVDPRREIATRQEWKRMMARTGLEDGVVLDIGCGLGELLDLFPAERWRKYGIEVSEHAAAHCRAKGIEFELPDGEGWADLVVLRGSLQHLDSPIQTLFESYRRLQPRGWLVALATPNAGGIVYRLFQDLPALDPPNNFVVFSDRVLRQCLENIGFRDISFVYPYLGTPYARPLRDHLSFAGRLIGFQRKFAFWRNMMECYAHR